MCLVGGGGGACDHSVHSVPDGRRRLILASAPAPVHV